MHPYIDIGSLTLTTYTILHSVGIVAGSMLGYRRLKRLQISTFAAMGILLLLIFSAHLGAHVYHVAANLARFLTNPRGLFNFWNQGLSIYGGLIGGGLAILLCSRLSRRSIWQLGDALAPAAVLALIFFRVGCYTRGCCHGLPCGEDSIFAGLRTRLIGNVETSVHPTQLYSAAAALVLLVVLMGLGRRKFFEGELLIVFLLLYSTQRFIIEFFRASYLIGRTPITLFSAPLNWNQLFAGAFFALGLILLAVRWRALREGVAECFRP